MSIITRMLKMTCVYWPPGGEDSGGHDFDDYGKPLYADSVELKCRWEDKAIEFISSTGTAEVSKSVVFVESDVRPGGVLFLGSLTDLTDEDVPKNNDGAWEIKQFNKVPNLRVTEYVRTAYL